MDGLNALIIDDSRDFVKLYTRTLQNTKLFNNIDTLVNPTEALAKVDNNYDLIFLDCILPNSDSVELSQEISAKIKSQNLKSKIVLISGILSDDMSSNLLTTPKTVKFLHKTSSAEELIDFLYKSFPSLSNIKPLTPLAKLSDIIEYLNSCYQTYPHELLLILPLLSRFEFSGKIHLSPKENAVVKLEFYNGKITAISSSSNFENSLGEILVNLGYLTREELSDYVQSTDFNENVPIGDTLIKKNIISPHSVDLSLKKQKYNRLKDMFSESPFKAQVLSDSVSIPLDNYGHLDLKDIVDVCIRNLVKTDAPKDLEFFQSYFSSTNFSVQELDPFFSQYQKYVSTAQELNSVTSHKYSSKNLRSLAIYFITNSILFPSKASSTSLNANEIMHLAKDLDHKIEANGNSYEVFGLNQNAATDQKVIAKYHEFSKIMHPDKINKKLDANTIKYVTEVFSKITEHFNNIKSSESRTSYNSLLQNKLNQQKITLSHKFESAKEHLLKGENSQAFNILSHNEFESHSLNDFELFYTWASIKANTSKYTRYLDDISQKSEKDYAAEEVYYYVKALIALKEKKPEQFKFNIKKSLDANSSFLPARREINLFKSNQEKSGSFTSWFNIKKSS